MYANILREATRLREQIENTEALKVKLGLSTRLHNISLASILSTRIGPNEGINAPILPAPERANFGTDKCTSDVLTFIATCKWANCDTQVTAGTTWLELLLFYIAMGGHMEAHQHMDLRVTTVRQAIELFKAAWNNVIRSPVQHCIL